LADLVNSLYAIIPQIVPSALNNANKPDIKSISPFKKYLGASGIPNHPVDKIPENASVINNHRARSL
jgi:hypothetical protein